MRAHIEAYISDKALGWSATSVRSERHRLNGISDALDGNPRTLWAVLQDYKPYSRVTMWVRVVSFYEWLIKEGHVAGPNTYKAFREERRNLFKNAYNPKLPDVTYEEAKQKIEGIKEDDIREKALQLLEGGLRYSESFTATGGTVVGKGGKSRKVFTGRLSTFTRSYSTFVRALRAVGLSPHSLRKVCATELARKGMREADLCKVFGWASFNTAKAYIAPLQDEAMQEVFNQLHGGSKLGHNKK